MCLSYGKIKSDWKFFNVCITKIPINSKGKKVPKIELGYSKVAKPNNYF